MNLLRLGDAVEVLLDHRGKTPKKLGADFTEHGVPVASAILVRDGRLDLTDARYVSHETHARWMPESTKAGDVLLTSEAPLGRVARVESDEPLVLGQRLFALRGGEGVLDSGYLFYALQTERVQSDLLGRATGTTVFGIRQSALRNVVIPAPDIEAQRGIAAVLGALDDKIAANVHARHIAVSLLQASFDACGPDKNPDGGVRLDDLIEVNPVRPMPRAADAVYLEMKQLPQGDMTVAEWSRRAPRGGARFTNGDTLLARITPCLENGKTGFVDFLDDDEIGIGSTEYIVLHSREGLPETFTYFLAKTQRFRDHAIKRMVGTSGRQRLSGSDLLDYPMGALDHRRVGEFASLSQALMPRLKASADEDRKLRGARDSLLPLLMSGKVRAKDAESVVGEVL